MKAADLLPDAIGRLRAAGIDDPARDARRLLAYALGVAADRLTLHLRDPVDAAASLRFESAVAARAARQPVAQIIGSRLFWGRPFRVTRDVLDPRPETETLVALALQEPFVRVLDLGTGSGAILLSLLADRPDATGMGVDLSAAALAVAAGNAAALGLAARAELSVSDWFSEVSGQFDLIVSNPPYITAAEMLTLAPEVRDWEPHPALAAPDDLAGLPDDGLAAFRAIAAAAPSHLLPGGRLLVECGPTQAQAVAELLQRAGLVAVAVHHDLDDRPRVVAGRKA